MAVAGFSGLVSCATGSGATFSVIDGIKSFQIGDSRDLLDITDFADSNIRSRLAGMRDITCDLSGDYEGADTGWLKLKACYDAGADAYVKIYTSAAATTAGFGYIFQVGSLDINADVDGKVEVSTSLMINNSSGTMSFAL